MASWKSVLKGDPTAWLLEEDNPSVRYFTLRDILDRPESDSDVRESRKRIMEVGPVPRILEKQTDGGYWGKAEDFYIRSKYKGTVWTLILLAELGANGRQPRVRKACEFVLENAQDRDSGGFSYVGNQTKGGQHSAVLPCLTGNMVWSMTRLGYLEDSRLKRGIDWIVRYQRFDDGIERAPSGWPYQSERCWGRHTCHMGVVKALAAFAEIPPTKRTAPVKKTIEGGVEYLLEHRIYKRSHDPSKVSIQKWLKFGFPVMWNTNALDILGILAGLGCRDGRMQDALDLVISKQDSQGRWALDSSFNGRTLVRIEQEGKPSKWVTLNALRVLRRLHA